MVVVHLQPPFRWKMVIPANCKARLSHLATLCTYLERNLKQLAFTLRVASPLPVLPLYIWVLMP